MNRCYLILLAGFLLIQPVQSVYAEDGLTTHKNKLIGILGGVGPEGPEGF